MSYELEIKRLQFEKEESSRKLQSLRKLQSEISRKITLAINRRNNISASIRHMKRGCINVTNHAIIRYYERENQLDFVSVRHKICYIKSYTHFSQVTDYDIVFYLQKVCKLDIEEIKDKIVTQEIREIADEKLEGEYDSGEGFKVVIVGKTIKTVIPIK